jgi:hypothetical protein
MSAHFRGSGSVLLRDDVQKDGRWVFLSQIIECHDDEVEANRRCQTFIMMHNALYPFGYNKGIGGRGSHGHMWDIEQRAKVAGEKNNRSKLTEAQVAAIYCISTTMVTKIKNRQAWKHVTRWFLI